MPSVLTILGIILFRRLGFIVGSAGLEGGGDYYLISRTLGVEFGGALGLILYVAQAVLIAFYCVGFGEGVQSLLGGSEILARVAATTAAVDLFGLAYSGVDLATGFQYVVMLILTAALVSFFVGAQATWAT